MVVVRGATAQMMDGPSVITLAITEVSVRLLHIAMSVRQPRARGAFHNALTFAEADQGADRAFDVDSQQL